MAEPWRTLKRVVTEALARARSGNDEIEWAASFAPRYDKVFESLTREELYGDSSELLDEGLLDGLFRRERRHEDGHFLGMYSEEGGELALERYGFLQLLRDKGFDPKVSMDLSNPDEHRLRIYDGEETPGHLLVELGAGLREFELPDGTECRLLFVNWLLMQDPRDDFPAGRPALPDQEHPGLGLFPHFGYLLRLVALRLDCDGLLNHPAHFHNASLYGRFFQFVNPSVEGWFRALERDLSDLSLAEATAAVDCGRVVDESGAPCTWEPAPQVAPITNRVRHWFASEEYRSAAANAHDQAHFVVRR
jgi:hypothetical protein